MGLLDLFKKKGAEEDKNASISAAQNNTTPPPEQSEPIDLSNVSYEEVTISAASTLANDTNTQAVSEPIEANSDNQPFLGNLEFTAIIDNLSQVPLAQRDDKWVEALLQHISTASLTCGDPQVIGGPDGFPYFQLHVPEKEKEFQCFVIQNMKDDFLLERGFGVVLHPQKEQPDIVLTYGDIVNYHINKHFFFNDNSFSNQSHSSQIEENEEVLIGDPNETVLPKKSRAVLKDFLAANGINDPKVVLMMRKKDDDAHRDLVFNITPDMFENEEKYTNVMRAIGWFLPRHYTYLSIKEDTFATHFQAL